MTEAEVKAALSLREDPSPPNPKYANYAAWKLPVEIAGDDYEVSLLFGRDSRKLEGVQIRGDGGMGTSGKTTITAIRVSRLRKLLTDKYGSPTEVEKSLEWRFKSTRIRLGSVTIPKVIDAAFLNYTSTAASQAERDKL